jgi:hypothetical protein
MIISIKNLTGIYQETSDMIISLKQLCDRPILYYRNRFTTAGMVLPAGRIVNHSNWSLMSLLEIAGTKVSSQIFFSKSLDKIGVTEIGRRSRQHDGRLTLDTYEL